MAKPLVMPSVTVRRVEGFSLSALAERLGEGSNIVRVGLPDSETTEKGDAIRKARQQKKVSIAGQKP
jgi:hypothetical protein